MDKRLQRASYWKTTVIAISALVSGCIVGVAALRLDLGAVVMSVVSTFSLAAFLVTCSGFVCLWRDGRDARGRPDIFFLLLRRNRDLLTERYVPIHRWLRPLFGKSLRRGDLVRVATRSHIESTLDEIGALGGLPFMSEMCAYLGKTYYVDRRIDKVFDVINGTGLRRLRDTVTLRDVRCSGQGHGGCQLECQVFWKEVWLQKLSLREERELKESLRQEAATKQAIPRPTAPTTIDGNAGFPLQKFVCQATSLYDATRHLRAWDIRQDLRPLISGNVGALAFMVGLFTRLFNLVQRSRRGARYPYFPDGLPKGPTPSTDLGLAAGDKVRVRSPGEIAKTLLRGRNRGLYFDRELVRFCGQPASVRYRAGQIIDRKTGFIVKLKTTCLILEGMQSTGEFLRFCPTNEHIFWREIWVKPIDPKSPTVGS